MARSQSIASRIRFFSFLLVTLPLCVSLLTFAVVSRILVVGGTHHDMVVELQHHKLTTERWLNEQLQSITFFAHTSISDLHDTAALQQALRVFLNYHTSFSQIFYASPDGSLLTGPELPVPINVGDRGYFQKARQGLPVVSPVLVSRFSHNPSLIFCAPLPFADGRFAGAVIGVTDLRTLDEALLRLHRRQNDQSFLATADGYLLTSRLQENTIILPRYNPEGIPVTRTVLPPEDSLSTPHFYRNTQGVYVLGVRLAFKSGQWLLVQERPVRAMLGGYSWIIAMTMAGALATAALLIPFLLKAGRRITGPIEEISTMSEELTHGHYDKECPYLHTADMPPEIRRLYDNFCFMAERVSQQMRDLEHLSFCDTLTGLHNRRHLAHEGTRTITACTEADLPCSCLMLDIDFFKQVNDAWGHDAGDMVLQSVARTISNAVRSKDMTIRMGGEEFAVIAPATDTASAFSLAERIRRNIESTPVQAADDEIRITISIGVADMGGAPIFGTTQLDDLLAKADRALYQAKKKGRNRTEIWSEKLIAAAPDG